MNGVLEYPVRCQHRVREVSRETKMMLADRYPVETSALRGRRLGEQIVDPGARVAGT
jgi:hypothetical protein